MKDFSKAAEVLRQGGRAILISVIKASGSVPRGEGAGLFVFQDGSVTGTVGGGLVEFNAIEKAKEKLAAGDRQAITEDFSMSNRDAAEQGMVCGGRVRLYYQTFSGEEAAACFETIAAAAEKDEDSWLYVPVEPGSEEGKIACFTREGTLSSCGGIKQVFDTEAFRHNKAELFETPAGDFYIEPLVSQGRVIVFGGGHVGQALVPVLNMLDFRTVVFEDRAEFADREHFPEPTRLVLGDFDHIDEQLELHEGDYAVIMTRGHQSDMEVLAQVLRKNLRYIGMMGSERKILTVYRRLTEQGFSDEDFAHVHAPIGLSIESETPQEIAISIAAELIHVKNAAE